VHHEDQSMDYMCKLRAIIKDIPIDKETPNTIVENSITELMTEKSHDALEYKVHKD
jgi:hypothetical protein